SLRRTPVELCRCRNDDRGLYVARCRCGPIESASTVTSFLTERPLAVLMAKTSLLALGAGRYAAVAYGSPLSVAQVRLLSVVRTAAQRSQIVQLHAVEHHVYRGRRLPLDVIAWLPRIGELPSCRLQVRVDQVNVEKGVGVQWESASRRRDVGWHRPARPR